ncbi:MAG: type II toxin-antitoxin system RelE/ParE family toxin [bacterium]
MQKEGKERMYEVILPKSVQKELDKTSDIYYSRIADKIVEMETNPRLIGCLKLSDSNEYRLRVGTYRILFEIDDKNTTVVIYKIEHRKEVNKKK